MVKLEFLLERNGIEYLLYKPTICRLYAKCYSSSERPPYFSRIIHHIRMIREFLFAHYVVVYLRKDDKFVGHLVVNRGGTRVAVSTAEDIVLGPIWIVPNHRGEGLCSDGIQRVLHDLGFSYRYAYEFIEDDNLASIQTVKKNGYKLVCRCAEYGILKTLRENECGKFLLYRYDGSE